MNEPNGRERERSGERRSMKNLHKWYLLIAGIVLGFLWNLLCLLGVIPLAKWPFTFAFTMFFCVASQLRVLFPKWFPKDEQPPKDPKDATKAEKVSAGAMLTLVFAWLVTVGACIVYPL